jgi:hypothetical protein
MKSRSFTGRLFYALPVLLHRHSKSSDQRYRQCLLLSNDLIGGMTLLTCKISGMKLFCLRTSASANFFHGLSAKY